MSLAGENGTQLTMPVMPAGGMGGYGMGGFGGDGWWGILFLIAIMCGGWGGFGGFGGIGGLMGMWPFLFGGFGNGFGGGNAQQGYDTRADLQRGFDNQAVINKLDGITNGLCDGFYATNNAINGVGTTVMQGFSQAELSRCNQQAALMQQLNAMQYQAQDCCCQTQRAIDAVNYNLATQSCDTRNTIQNTTRDIIDNQNSNARAIMDFMIQDKLSAKDARIATLENQLSQANQNSVLGARIDAATAEILRRSGHDCPSAAYIVQPPTPVNFPTNCCGTFTGYNNGCGGCGTC